MRRWSRNLLAGGVLASVLVGALGAVLIVRWAGGGGPESTSQANGDVPPLDLASVSAEMSDHYRYAADHREEYSEIPCFCGCEESVGHRNLYDCFVRADGKGWDMHASGCQVCFGESEIAREVIDNGGGAAAARDAVVAEFDWDPTEQFPTDSQ